MQKIYDVIAIGEVLIDLLGLEHANSLQDTDQFQKHLGGSAANLAMNIAKQGKNVLLSAAVGNDRFGRYIIEELEGAEVDTRLVQLVSGLPTSLVAVARSIFTPDFLIYRAADAHVQPLPEALVQQTQILHTTCFALSQEPSRSSILLAARQAKKANTTLSIDLNYAEEVWPNKQEALKVIEQYLSLNPLVKLSEDDWQRLFGASIPSEEALIQHLHEAGAYLVCLTKGAKGCTLSVEGERRHFEAGKVEKIVHATGAGDAFWSGFLAAYLDKESWEACIQRANYIVGIKLQHFGPLPKLSNI